ncbi:OB-fold protein [Rhodanobacter geophilus]|uniref:Zinc-ribbon domain-containing protein n=1 Tax=Rhodanobacter geophilus TaxID=3162488 RepID=A0ABV3QLB1_9GAMM
MALIKCPDCGQEISDQAPSCIKCGRPLLKTPSAPPEFTVSRNKPQPKKKSTSLLGWIVVLVLGWIAYEFIASSYSGYVARSKAYEAQSESPQDPTPQGDGADAASTAPEAPAEPRMQVTPALLYQMYNANEVAADDKFKGRLLELTAPVNSIDKDFTDSAVLRFEVAAYTYVQATLDDSQKPRAAQLSIGQPVSLECQSVHRILDSPMLDHCIIVN